MTHLSPLDFFRELMDCTYGLFSWCYDASGELFYSNCERETLLNTMFTHSECKDYLFAYAKEHTEPLLLSVPSGLIWIAVIEKENNAIHYIHVLGPVFSTTHTKEDLQRQLFPYDLSITVKKDLIQVMHHLPMISITTLHECAIMLHYTVNREQLNISDIAHQKTADPTTPNYDLQKAHATKHHGIWAAEQFLLQMVREGNLNYDTDLKKASNASSGIHLNANSPMRQAQDSIIIFTSLCTREAIKGGLPSETAYTLGDYYIQDIENSKTLSELTAISHTMYDDFIHRVHKCQTDDHLSKHIQSCCEYIKLHIEEKLKIELIAQHVGYTEYYLTRKFKKEMQCSINDYIKICKVERAKLLLSSTSQSIQDISDSLSFSSRSYFADTFRKVVGIAPAEYRTQNLNL